MVLFLRGLGYYKICFEAFYSLLLFIAWFSHYTRMSALSWGQESVDNKLGKALHLRISQPTPYG